MFDRALAALNSDDLLIAKKLALKLVRIEKQNFSCMHLLAVIHGKLGEVAPAEKAFVEAAKLAPGDTERKQLYEQLGQMLLANHRPDRAAKYFVKLQRLAPTRADIAHYLAEAYHRNRQYQAALAEYERTIELSDATPDIVTRKAACLRGMGEIHEAIKCLEKIATTLPVPVDALTALIDCYMEVDAYEQAESLLLKAIESEPANAQLHYQLALLYRNFGELARSADRFEKTLSLAPEAATVYYNYVRIKKFLPGDPIVARMQDRIAKLPATNETAAQLKDKTELLFSLGKVAEDCQQYDEAFSYWKSANELKRRTYEYDIRTDKQQLAAIKKVFKSGLVDKLQLDRPGEPIPIFVLGMPRAGSTLVEQILTSHTAIRGLGELTLLPELLGELERRAGSTYPHVINRVGRRELQSMADSYLTCASRDGSHRFFTDKLPGNFWRIGLIRILFPGSPIIHAYRDPIDTAFSCFKHLFSGPQQFAYDLKEIQRYILLYQELMTFWHELFPGAIFDLEYEKLVADPQGTVESLLSFCDLSFEPDCLSFYKTRRAVRSSSAAQIRQPLHTGAVGAWQHYKGHLQELIDPA